jgi:Flp pilus assembly protein TadG
MTMRRWKKATTGRRGAAIIEFAVCAPLLFLLILGMFEVGRYINVGEMVTNASRYGARQAALSGATVSTVQTQTKTFLSSSGVNAATATVAVENETSPGNGAFAATSDLSSVPVGSAVRIRVTVDFAQVTWVPQGFFKSVLPSTISGVTVMRKESS